MTDHANLIATALWKHPLATDDKAAADILTAFAAAGLVIGPKEPTEAMLKVGVVALNNCTHYSAILGHLVPSIYRAMIDTP